MSEQFNLVDQTNLFKINYYKKSENMYNSDNVLQGVMQLVKSKEKQFTHQKTIKVLS